MKTGTLGSPATFAGEAAREMRANYSFLGEAAYFSSMPACWEALKNGEIDVLVMGIERTGQPHQGLPILENNFYVVGQKALPLACNLYIKPGADPARFTKITGHGSVHQCAPYLEARFPGVPRVMHDLNSVDAAREMLAGDGSFAVVGTNTLQEIVPGLELLDTDIDRGKAFSSWWAMAREPIFVDMPDFVVVTLRGRPNGMFGNLVGAVGECGFSTRAVGAFPVFEDLSVYDYLVTFTGRGALVDVVKAVDAVPGARLAGAFHSG